MDGNTQSKGFFNIDEPLSPRKSVFKDNDYTGQFAQTTNEFKFNKPGQYSKQINIEKESDFDFKKIMQM